MWINWNSANPDIKYCLVKEMISILVLHVAIPSRIRIHDAKHRTGEIGEMAALGFGCCVCGLWWMCDWGWTQSLANLQQRRSEYASLAACAFSVNLFARKLVRTFDAIPRIYLGHCARVNCYLPTENSFDILAKTASALHTTTITTIIYIYNIVDSGGLSWTGAKLRKFTPG